MLHEDPLSGLPYYHHAASGQTVWELSHIPTTAPAVPASHFNAAGDVRAAPPLPPLPEPPQLRGSISRNAGSVVMMGQPIFVDRAPSSGLTLPDL